MIPRRPVRAPRQRSSDPLPKGEQRPPPRGGSFLRRGWAHAADGQRQCRHIEFGPGPCHRTAAVHARRSPLLPHHPRRPLCPARRIPLRPAQRERELAYVESRSCGDPCAGGGRCRCSQRLPRWMVDRATTLRTHTRLPLSRLALRRTGSRRRGRRTACAAQECAADAASRDRGEESPRHGLTLPAADSPGLTCGYVRE